MADFLPTQQNPYEDRITQILRERAKPQEPTLEQIYGAAEASYGTNQSVGDVLASINAPKIQAQNRELESTKALYDMFEQKRAQGDKQAQALFDRISMFTGGDPEGTALFLEELHNDPESIDPSNSYQVMTKLAGIAKKTGYKPLDIKLKEAQIRAQDALATRRSAGGSGGGSSVFAQTMAAIDNDPQLSKLPTIDKIRLAQNKLGTNLTVTSTGDVIEMSGAPEALGTLKESEAFGSKVGQLGAEGYASLPKLERSANSALSKSQNVINKIDSVSDRVDGLTAGFGGTLLSKIPGSAARDLQRDLDTILANMGFEELQQMRDNSPTGGALGQVAVREIELLQAIRANLTQDQSPEQLKRNLQEAKSSMQGSMRRLQEAYNQDLELYGEAGTRNLGRGAPSVLERQVPIEPQQAIDWQEYFK